MRKNDMILAGAVLAVAFVLFCLQKAEDLSDGPGTVIVFQGREQVASYPLEENRTETFLSPDGGKNILVIENGEAYIQDADCPDRVCMRQGRISAAGQTLTCLPHRLQITIEGGAGTGLDAVTG